MSLPSPLRRTAERFEHFATAVYPGKSPLYATLAAKIAEDPELLELAAAAEEKDALPNLFLASVHLSSSTAPGINWSRSIPASMVHRDDTTMLMHTFEALFSNIETRFVK